MLTITRHPRRLFRPATAPADEEWVYQLALPLQLSATQAGLFVNIRRGGMNMVDLEVGNDLVIIDRLDGIASAPTIAINRSDRQPHPRLGVNTLMARYPIAAGFVPVGAKRADGSPHPHAGTGFGVSNVIGFPLDGSGKRVGDFRDRLQFMEVQQYAMIDGVFRITTSQLVGFDDLFPGYRIVNRPIGHAIADGDDLIYGMSGGQIGVTTRNAPGDVSGKASGGASGGAGAGVNVGAVLTRWRREAGAWRIVECNQVSGPDGSFEPSLVRDTDGSLLMSARDPTGSVGSQAGSPLENSIRVWRSIDGGRGWEKFLHAEQVRACTPVTIGKAGDGTVYIASNPHRQLDTHGQKQRHSILLREELVAWPLAPDRRSLTPPIMARDTNADFGKPPGGSIWYADHPAGLTVRLADGRWHHLFCYRALEQNENQGSQPPTEHTGCYVEEGITAGVSTGDWRF